MVCARIIEPTSKRDTLRVLGDVGVPAPALNTLYRCLRRVQERDYRDRLARACAGYSAAATGTGGLILYDVTTLHFENDNEDDLRRVGMSKEHRVDPQVQVGLLVDPSGFPLEVHLFDGSIGETKTLIPVLHAFRDRHGLAEVVVVADAGMLSAGNLNALEDAGYSFIVGSRLTKAPYDLADHFERHGDWFADGQILESSRVMGTGSAGRARRIVYQYSFKRRKRDDKAIDARLVLVAGHRPYGVWPLLQCGRLGASLGVRQFGDVNQGLKSNRCRQAVSNVRNVGSEAPNLPKKLRSHAGVVFLRCHGDLALFPLPSGRDSLGQGIHIIQVHADETGANPVGREDACTNPLANGTRVDSPADVGGGLAHCCPTGGVGVCRYGRRRDAHCAS
ncbi:IS1634 family transposase [Raineyella fluvialis]|uniref:IS1634 family transposase n=1 Tax=Raineyella fluvialis TaxID=2662261 RepID=A0A5Q2FAG4_9ACTN|nr:IS1634 family transposase [Raineyella fluvialis]